MTTSQIDDIWRRDRPYLVDLAFRMTGRIQDAEDAVQEAFSRLLAVDLGEIDDVRGWLVVVVSRICLDHLRSAHHRREAHVGSLDDGAVPAPSAPDPADRVTLDDSVRMALLVILEQLSPPERAVFVLHDVFRFSFEAVAGIVGRTPAACRQIASRARRRIEEETGPGRFQPEVEEQHELAEGFIAACAGGDLEALLRLLDPDVVGLADFGPGGMTLRPIRGRDLVSRALLAFYGPRRQVTLVSQPVNGLPGVLAFEAGVLTAMLSFKLRDGRIFDIHATRDPAKLAFASSQFRKG